MTYILIKEKDKVAVIDEMTSKPIIKTSKEECDKYIQKRFDEEGLDWRSGFLFKTRQDDNIYEFVHRDTLERITT